MLLNVSDSHAPPIERSGLCLDLNRREKQDCPSWKVPNLGTLRTVVHVRGSRESHQSRSRAHFGKPRLLLFTRNTFQVHEAAQRFH